MTADINKIQLKLYQDIRGTVGGLKDLYIVVDPSGKYNYLNYQRRFTIEYEVYHENGRDTVYGMDKKEFDEIDNVMTQVYRNPSYRNMLNYFGGYNDTN